MACIKTNEVKKFNFLDAKSEINRQHVFFVLSGGMWLGFKPCPSHCYLRGETLIYFVSRGEGSSTPGHVSCYETGISSGRMGPFAHVRLAPFFVLTS